MEVQYIASLPAEVGAIMAKIRSTIRKAAPDAEETEKPARGPPRVLSTRPRHAGRIPRASAGRGVIQLVVVPLLFSANK